MSHDEAPRRRVAVLFRSLGPYHHSRLEALDKRCSLAAVAFSSGDEATPPGQRGGATAFDHRTLFPGPDVARRPPRAVIEAVSRELHDIGPAVVAVPGWSEPAALAALAWCLKEGVPAVVMSDSGEEDEIRRPHKEWAKARMVRLFRAALVAGERSSAYVAKLGLSRDRRFVGYDVVDNDYFRGAADAARAASGTLRRKHGLPDAYFLASARFVAKKNIAGLLHAYADYARSPGVSPWPLVILGDGPLRESILAERRALGLEGAVHLPGFRQYHELPLYYGLAGAFVHASTTEQWGLVVNEAMAAGLPVLVSHRCGCVPELVQDGVNGFAFDPADRGRLVRLLHRIAHGDLDRAAMGRASVRIIEEWGPERFAGGMMNAVAAAIDAPASRPGLLDRTLLRALIYR